MAERERLELAARAFWRNTDVSFEWDEGEGAIVYCDPDNQDLNGNDRPMVWDPRECNHLAFLLQVRLGLSMLAGDYGVHIEVGGDGRMRPLIWEPYPSCSNLDDRARVARGALVSAAAELGKAMAAGGEQS